MESEKNDTRQETDTIKRVMPKYKYKPEYCQMLIDHMKQGKPISTFGVKVSVTRATIHEWINEIPEFKEAYDFGFQLAQDWHDTRLNIKMSGQEVKGVDAKKIDTTALIFALKTRFHESYGEKAEIINKNIEIKISEDDKEL